MKEREGNGRKETKERKEEKKKKLGKRKAREICLGRTKQIDNWTEWKREIGKSKLKKVKKIKILNKRIRSMTVLISFL
jgi:methionine aminopeptidase